MSRKYKLMDISGQNFGFWTVKYRSDRKHFWFCQCICGIEKSIRQDSLRRGDTVSCGCKRSEKLAERQTTHNLSREPEYGTWKMMISRCGDPLNKSYHDYGGRGITVCERWKNSIKNFIQDMGTRPSLLHSIDRKQNDGNYDAENCRWATRVEQQRNTRSNHFVSYLGQTKSLSEWSEITGIKARTLSTRINILGWSVERVMTNKVRTSHSKSRQKAKPL